MEKLKVGVIGCGAMGASHFDAYGRMLDLVEVTALCDIKDEALESAAARWPDARTEKDFRELLKPGDLDLVSVVTMPRTHCEISLVALESGANVLCEKPFSMNVDEADQMLARAKEADKLIQVGTNMRHMLEAGILKDLVESGQLGKPSYIRAWTYYTDLPWWGPHHIKEISAGGALASTAIHIADLALWVAGSPDPISVSGSTHQLFPKKRASSAPSVEAHDSYNVEDIAVAHIRLADGGTFILEGTWAHERVASHYSFEIICEKGTISFDPLLILMDEGGQIVDRTPVDYAEPAQRHSWGDSVYRELLRFATAIRDGTPPAQTPREIRNLQLIQDSIYESAARGCEVRLDKTIDNSLAGE